MTVTFYKNNSEREKLDKSLTTTIENMTGVTKTELDVLRPVLILQFTNEIYNALLDSNYFFIVETGRYYFMGKDLTIQNNQMIIVSGTVDPLTSHKDLIRNQTAVIQRQENSYNLYLDDGTFKTYQNPIIQQKTFPKGFNFNNYTYVLYTTGHNNIS